MPPPTPRHIFEKAVKESKSLNDLIRKTHLSKQAIYDCGDSYGIKIRKRWKKITQDGYLPYDSPKNHRRIAEKVLGRKLKYGEVVHHIDGNKTNNKNNNLLICTISYHHWLHWRMSYLFQQEHFAK